MKKLLSIVLLCVMGSGVSAVWVDDFESYPSAWTQIPAPWETAAGVVSLYVQPNGYLGSNGAGGPGGWNNSHQWRATDGDDVEQVFAKLMDDSSLDSSTVAVSSQRLQVHYGR